MCQQGQLRESRIKKLESIGFSWELHMDWDSRMQQLRVFKAKYGHCNVPQQIKMNGKGRVGTCSLGTWVTMQRMKRRSGRLSERQKEQLENIGFSWGLHAEWESRYEVLSLFRALLASALQCSAALFQPLHGLPPLAIPWCLLVRYFANFPPDGGPCARWVRLGSVNQCMAHTAANMESCSWHIHALACLRQSLEHADPRWCRLDWNAELLAYLRPLKRLV